MKTPFGYEFFHKIKRSISDLLGELFKIRLAARQGLLRNFRIGRLAKALTKRYPKSQAEILVYEPVDQHRHAGFVKITYHSMEICIRVVECETPAGMAKILEILHNSAYNR